MRIIAVDDEEIALEILSDSVTQGNSLSHINDLPKLILMHINSRTIREFF